jgi:type IV secretory pathway VirB2 component (pilin)
MLFVVSSVALADSGSEAQLGTFLQGIADFLIRVIGPAILVIGVCVGGISMATGNEGGVGRGIMAAIGGAIIMMSRAILDLIQRLTGF